MDLSSAFEFRVSEAGVPIIVRKGEKWAEKPVAPTELVAASGAGSDSSPSNDEDAGKASGREQERLIESSKGRIVSQGKIGGRFSEAESREYYKRRHEMFSELLQKQRDAIIADEQPDISITLPDGKVLKGKCNVTTPSEIAEGISKSLLKRCVVAQVVYSKRHCNTDVVATEEEEDDVEDEVLDEEEYEKRRAGAAATPILWDMNRPLEGDCELFLKTFKDKEGKATFWHSSAHVLGHALEQKFGVKLSNGPPVKGGFYYDAFMGEGTVHQADYAAMEAEAKKLSKSKAPFERLVITKEQALEMFADNPFKVALIKNKVPEGAVTSAYRCGELIDLCTGPHIPSTGMVAELKILRNSQAFWLGEQANDSLQRVYAVAFPDKKEMKQHMKMLEEAKQRDHRVVGTAQELFMFHELSPGSAFWLPHGARVFSKLTEFIREQYWARGFQEVITPNIFNVDLWRVSGHAKHYMENIFSFDVEKQLYGMKPMNCPGHCLIFRHGRRTFKDLPLRVADFGVLHRNEYSGALTGLTRVRRFQQDDAHCFIRRDQIQDEVGFALDFMDDVYQTLGFTYDLDLSTKPKKALGSQDLWDLAESEMKQALNKFGKPWKVNPGDGAFYGPKIDIKVYDALGRRHQCATIQLDFQLPIRFDLRYALPNEGGAAAAAAEDKPGKEAGDGGKPAEDESKAKEDKPAGEKYGNFIVGAPEPPAGFARPIMVHRAILGSVERMAAVLTEHTGGKWPFWLSPRQVKIVPISPAHQQFAVEVANMLQDVRIHADADVSGNQLGKGIREAQVQQYNFIWCVGTKEAENRAVTVRLNGEKKDIGVFSLDEAIDRLQYLQVLRCKDNSDFSLDAAKGGEMAARAALRKKYQLVRAKQPIPEGAKLSKGALSSTQEMPKDIEEQLARLRAEMSGAAAGEPSSDTAGAAGGGGAPQDPVS